MEKNFNFTTAFAMRCNAEQFESVENALTKMGYSTFRSIVEGEYLCTNYAGVNNKVGLSSVQYFQGHLTIETFNRNLCLALAAMTDKPDGIVGEWFKRTVPDDRASSLQKEYFMLKERKDDYVVDSNDETHNVQNIRKATADELIKYFSEIKPEQKQPETDPQIEALQKRIEDLERNVKLLTTNMDKVIHQPEPKRYDIKTLSDIIDCTNESNLDNFLIDFKNLLILAHKAKAKGKKLNNAEFTWIDDGKNDILSYDIF